MQELMIFGRDTISFLIGIVEGTIVLVTGQIAGFGHGLAICNVLACKEEPFLADVATNGIAGFVFE